MHTISNTSRYFMALCWLLSTAVAAAVQQPVLTHALTATVNVGAPVGPITIDGEKDYTVVEPITGGRICGVINATISGGAAVLMVSNSTIARPSVEIWGMTDDDEPYFVQASGVGIPGAQIATISITIGGAYGYLEDEYMVATFTDNKKEPPTKSTIEAWIVSRQ